MKSNFAVAFGIGIVCIAIALAGILYMQRGAVMELPGKFLKVRTAPMNDDSTAVVIDFRVSNPSDVLFVVRSVSVEMDDNEGKSYLGQVAAESDAKALFEAVPLLGQKFNDTLVVRDRIAAHTTQDRMVAARFEAPEAKLEARKRFIVRIEEVDGKSFELSEH